MLKAIMVESNSFYENYWDKIQSKTNPLSIFCRLNDKGVSYKEAKKCSLIYEKYFFNVFFANNGKRGLITRLLGIKDFVHHSEKIV